MDSNERNLMLRIIEAARCLAYEADQVCDDGVSSERFRIAVATFYEAYSAYLRDRDNEV